MSSHGSRVGHLAWAKTRALEYVDQGATGDAIRSLTSDLAKHPGTHRHPAIMQMTKLAAEGRFTQPGELRRYIEQDVT